MAADNVKLSVELVSKGFDKLNSSLDKVGASLTQVGTRVAAFGAAIAAPLALAAREAIKASENFSQVVVQLDKMDRSAGALTKLRDGLGDIASASGTDIANTTKAAFLALSSGVKNTDLEGFLRDTSKAAVGGFADLTDVVNVGTSALDSYRAQGLKLNDALDIMFAATKFGKMEFKDMAQSLGPLLPIAASAGVTFQEATAAVAALTRAGFDTPGAVTAVRSAMVQVYKPTTDAADAAAELGIKFDVATLKSKGLKTFILEIAKATEGLPNREELMGKLFGDVRGLSGMLALTADNSRLLSEGLTAVATSSGLVSDAFETATENDIGFVWRQLGTAWDTFVIKFGTEVTTMLKPAIEKVIAWLRELGGSNFAAAWASGLSSVVDLFIQLVDIAIPFVMLHGELIASILQWGGFAAIVGPVVLLFGTLLTSTTAIVTALAAVPALLGPWGMLATAIVLVITNWESLSGTVEQWFDDTRFMLGEQATTWEVFWTTLKTKAGEAFDWVLEKANGITAWFEDKFPGFTDAVNGMADGIWAFGEMIGTFFDMTLGALWEWVKKIAAEIPKLIDKAKSMIGLGGGSGSSDAMARTAEAYNAFVNRPEDELQDIPLEFANGGLVTRPTLALVGEAGPELITPLTGANAGRGMTINVVSNAADPRLVAQEVARIFRQTARLSA